MNSSQFIWVGVNRVEDGRVLAPMSVKPEDKLGCHSVRSPSVVETWSLIGLGSPIQWSWLTVSHMDSLVSSSS